MITCTRALLTALCILAGAVLIQAQSPPSPLSKQSTEKSSKQSDSDPAADLERATAILLLTSLANDARSYSDLSLRARVQARVADALWETDKESARELFVRAWESAETAEKEAVRQADDRTKDQAGSGVVASTPKLREEILRLAARHDQKLGELLLAKLAKQKEEELANTSSSSASAPAHIDPTKPLPPAVQQRLRLATQLLSDGDVGRALAFAAPALTHATMQGVTFLSLLREKQESVADLQYSALLAREAADPLSDANTVSILSSYIFTPFLFVTVNRNGGAGVAQLRGPTPAPSVSPALRMSFLRQALNVLLRPIPPEDRDQTSSGRAGTYLIILRLLPLFDQYASDLAPLLRAQLAALSNQPNSSPGLNEALTKGITSETRLASQSQDDLDQIARLSNSDLRDHAYADAAIRAARRGDATYGKFFEKIESSELRQRVRALIDFTVTQYALDKKDVEEAVRLAKSGDLTHIQRVWAYTEAASLVSESDPIFAIHLLEAAEAEADRIDVSDLDHAHSIVAIATRFVTLDKPRAWTMLSDAVKAANKVENFSGEGGRVGTVLQTKLGIWAVDLNVPSFSLINLFPSFVNDDLYRTIDLAKGINSQSARAGATIAIARTILSQKRSARPISP